MVDEHAVAVIGSRPPHTGRPLSPNPSQQTAWPLDDSRAVWLVLMAGMALLDHSGVAALDVQANKEHNVRTPTAVGAALPHGSSLSNVCSRPEPFDGLSNGRCTPCPALCLLAAGRRRQQLNG